MDVERLKTLRALCKATSKYDHEGLKPSYGVLVELIDALLPFSAKLVIDCRAQNAPRSDQSSSDDSQHVQE